METLLVRLEGALGSPNRRKAVRALSLKCTDAELLELFDLTLSHHADVHTLVQVEIDKRKYDLLTDQIDALRQTKPRGTAIPVWIMSFLAMVLAGIAASPVISGWVQSPKPITPAPATTMSLQEAAELGALIAWKYPKIPPPPNDPASSRGSQKDDSTEKR